MKGIGLRGKMAIFIILYTVTALSLISVFVYQTVQEEQANSRWSQMSLRAVQWGGYIADRLASGIAPGDIRGGPAAPVSPPRNADEENDSDPAREFAALIECESVAVYSEKGERIVVVKKHGNGRLPFRIGPGAEEPEVPEEERGGLAMMVPLSLGGVGRTVYCHFGLPVDRGDLSRVYKAIAQVGITLVVLVLLLALAAHRIIVRPILTITDATELVSEGDLSEHIRVTTGDELETLARRFNRMLGRVRKMQEMALDSSPLTGLPGNNSIQNRIDNAIADAEKVCVVYADLDSFKAYNDVYGFEAGDRAIKMTAEVIQEALAGLPEQETFVGHIGGDDFVAVLPDSHAGSFGRAVCDDFDFNVKELYSEKDVKRGGIRAVDREGRERRFPFMSISLGAVSLASGRFCHFSEVASIAAEVKKAAKSKEGSSFVMDKRKGSPVRFERYSDTDVMPAVKNP